MSGIPGNPSTIKGGTLKTLVIIVPAYNEEEHIAQTLKSLPTELPGISVKILVVDDGSEDNTKEEAQKGGADEIVSLHPHQGLGHAFMMGVEKALMMGADILVNFDADGQYKPEDIPRLIQPIKEKKADIVLGDRQVGNNPHFSKMKRLLQRLGSWVVRRVCGLDIKDATTGFRALSRKAALHLNIFSRYTYTVEMLIQAGVNQMAVVSVPVKTNPPKRPSRLFRSIPQYMVKTGWTLFRMFILYRPLLAFFILGCFPFILGSSLFIRFFYYFFSGSGHGHIQSLIVGAVLLILTFFLWTLAFLADILSINRRLLEKLLYQERLKPTVLSDNPSPPSEKSS